MFDKYLPHLSLVLLALLLVGYFSTGASREDSEKDTLTFSNTASWDTYHLDLLNSPFRYPESHFSQIALPPPPKNSSPETKQELATLVSYIALRTPQKLEDIYAEQETETIQFGRERLVVYMDGKKYPATALLLQDSFHDLTILTLREKKRFDRVRPSVLDAAVTTAIAIPAHPSYPAGHSAQTHFLAYVFGELAPQMRQTFLDRADEISENRAIAGLHYPSDSAAGVLLAQQFFDIMMRNEKFVTLLAAAKKEWAMHPELLQAPATQ